MIDAQVILRNSDYKKFDSITISNKNVDKKINLSNLKRYSFMDGDMVIYNNIKYDFSINNDTLIFFDKIRQIEEVVLVKNKIENKETKKKVKSKRGNGFANVFPNYYTATFVKKNKKKSFRNF